MCQRPGKSRRRRLEALTMTLNLIPQKEHELREPNGILLKKHKEKRKEQTTKNEA